MELLSIEASRLAFHYPHRPKSLIAPNIKTVSSMMTVRVPFDQGALDIRVEFPLQGDCHSAHGLRVTADSSLLRSGVWDCSPSAVHHYFRA